MLQIRRIPKEYTTIVLRSSYSSSTKKIRIPDWRAREKQPSNKAPKINHSFNGDDSFFKDLFQNRPKIVRTNIGEQSNVEALRKLIKNKPKITKPTDMSEVKLDLSKSNKQLVKMIQNKSQKNNKERYDIPSEDWLKNFSESEIKEISRLFKKLATTAKVSGKSMDQPISIGDLVTLGTENLRLYMVVGTPKSFDSRICTFLSDKGEIIFTTFHSIGYRFSGVIPEKFHDILKKFIVLEKKYLDTTPVGVPDAKFSKSNDALPKELQDENASGIVEEGEGEESEYEPNNLIVQQASSQLLTNTDVRTFIVPLVARSIYKQALIDISNLSSDKLGSMNLLLEELHTELQYDDHGQLNAPRTISIFEILYRLKYVGPDNKTDLNLGKSLNNVKDYENMEYPITDVLALLALLKVQSKLWKIIPAKSSFTPTKVRISSVAQISEEDRLSKFLASNKGMDEIVKSFKFSLTGKQISKKNMKQFKDIVALMKEYINDRFKDDNAMSTQVNSVIRKLDKLLIELKIPIDELYKNEYSSGRAYDLLTKLNNGTNFNPLLWSKETGISNKSPSVDVYSKQKVYEYFDSRDDCEEDKLLKTSMEANFYSTDPLKDVREDMKDTAIYCIDSPNAHEIDDGISIEEDGDEYAVSIHVAEPTSFIKPDSTISSIAFEKASTTYMPDEAFPMLPKVISDMAGLGIPDKDTRTFVVQYRIEKQLLDEFINKKLELANYTPSEELLQKIEKQINAKNKIFFATTRNYRQGFTYDKVNEVLATKELREQYKLTGETKDSDFNNLIKLEHISSLLMSIRRSKHAFIHANSNSQVYVEKSDTSYTESSFERTDENKLIIELANSLDAIIMSQSSITGVSTLLVSENMIIANYLTAKFASDNNIKILYRYLDPNFNEELVKEYNDIMKEQDSTGTDQLVQMYSFFTRGAITDKPRKHFLMGLSMYSNITSPLRRYIDLVNQWKIQDYFLDRVTVADESIPGIVSYLNGQNEVIRNNQERATSFWQGLFLRTYRDKLNEGGVDKPIDFKLRLVTSPKKGASVSVYMPDFKGIKAHVEVSPELLKDVESEKLKVGGILDSNRLRMKQVDFLENEVIFEYK